MNRPALDDLRDRLLAQAAKILLDRILEDGGEALSTSDPADDGSRPPHARPRSRSRVTATRGRTRTYPRPLRDADDEKVLRCPAPGCGAPFVTVAAYHLHYGHAHKDPQGARP